MRMILSLYNKNIEDKIKNKYYSKYEIIVANEHKYLLDYINEKQEEIIIIKKNTKNDIEFMDLISKMKNKNSKLRFIILVKELNQNLKELLLAKEIFNIIEGSEFLFDDLVELIENPKMIIYKERKSKNSKSKIICVTGSRGVGKTITSLAIGKLIAKNRKHVLIIDLDLLNPTMDTYLNINKNYSLSDYINDVINSKLKTISNYETSDYEFKNLKYILNTRNMGIPNNETIIKIIDTLENFYDYIIVDTSTLMMNKIYNIAKNKNYNIVHVIEPGKKQLKNYKIDTVYIENSMLSKSIIICNKCDFINNLKRCNKDYNFNIDGYIKYINFFRYKNNVNIKFKGNLNKVLKDVGLIKFEKLKLKIINKILNLGDEKK